MVSTRILKGAKVVVVYEDSTRATKDFLGTATGRAKAISEARKILTRMSKGTEIRSVTVENIWSAPGETVSLEMSSK